MNIPAGMFSIINSGPRTSPAGIGWGAKRSGACRCIRTSWPSWNAGAWQRIFHPSGAYISWVAQLCSDLPDRPPAFLKKAALLSGFLAAANFTLVHYDWLILPVPLLIFLGLTVVLLLLNKDKNNNLVCVGLVGPADRDHGAWRRQNTDFCCPGVELFILERSAGGMGEDIKNVSPDAHRRNACFGFDGPA